MAARYALCYAPEPGSPLEAFGRRWLEGDPATGEQAPRLALPDPARLEEITRAAALWIPRYAETAIPTGRQEHARGAASGGCVLRRDARRVRASTAPVGGARPYPCARAEWALCGPRLARRRQGGLTARQDQLLIRWGYPYVLEEFRFHLTLTGSLDDEAEREAVRRMLVPLAMPHCENPVAVRSICLFAQTDGTAPFRIARRYAFGG